MLSRMVVFVFLATLLLAGLHYYVYVRIGRYLALGAGERRLLKLVLGGLFLLLWTAMPLSRALGLRSGQRLSLVVFVWLGTLVLLCVVLLGGDLLRLLYSNAERLRPNPADPERRAWLERLLGLATLGLGGGLSGYALFEGLRRVAVKPVTVALRRLPPALQGFRIAQLTDVHIGQASLDGRWLNEVVDRVNSLNTDVIVITGDLVDGSVEKLRAHVAPLGRLKAAHGVFFVTGNHEYYSGPDEWIAELRRLGIKVLRNERVTIQRGDAAFELAGIDDHHASSHPGHGADLPKALAGRDPSRAVVLLAHQPIAVHEAARLNVDLQLSGHTHGGQLWPWRYLVRLQQPFIAGLHRVEETMLYVSCGTGYWGPPMRLGSPAEITELTLTT